MTAARATQVGVIYNARKEIRYGRRERYTDEDNEQGAACHGDGSGCLRRRMRAARHVWPQGDRQNQLQLNAAQATEGNKMNKDPNGRYASVNGLRLYHEIHKNGLLGEE
jgi:hypothetical protein